MLDRILIPLDGSPTAEAILPQVRRLLLRAESEVLLLRAVEAPPGMGADAPVVLAELHDAASAYLQTTAARLLDQGIRVRPMVQVGYPAEVIVETASREQAGFVAMSTHGRSGIARWVFGSVTEKVLRSRLPVPLLLVRSFPSKGLEEELPVRKILVPIDGSKPSLAIVRPAAELAHPFDAKVLLLHVEEREPSLPLPTDSKLKEAVDAFAALHVSAMGLVAGGDPASEILEACSVHRADLIAMSTHGRSGLSRWVLGSVTEKVLRTATVPMLVVPSGLP